MATYDLSMDQSFDLLLRHSSQTNTKIRVVAEHVVRNGGLTSEGGQTDSTST
jgi:hypothetical protein